MKEGQASRTAEYMALFRALENKVPAGRRVFVDPFAHCFLTPQLALVCNLASFPGIRSAINAWIDYRWPGARTSAIARTRFIDDAVAMALHSGIEQMVMLGAGFDARAYRIPSLNNISVFEVDHPSTSFMKLSAIKRILGSLPGNVQFVSVDFNAETLKSKMKAAAFDSSRHTLFIWEGVTNYLNESSVNATLQWCSDAAPGSKLIFTYIDRRVLDDPYRFDGTQKLFATLRADGER